MKIDTELQDQTPPTDDERRVADDAANAAFEQAFGDGEKTQPPAESPAPAATPAAAPAPAAAAPTPAPNAPAPSPAAAAPATSAEEDDDPFAGLHPKLRDMLGNHQKLAAQAGRVPGLTSQVTRMARELEALKKERAAAPAPTPSPAAPTPAQAAIDQIRGELPEVADAIELALNQKTPAAPTPPAPAPAADPGGDAETDQAAALREVHPDWDVKFMSPDFQLWLGLQPAEFQTKVQTTDQAVIVSHALTKFDAHQAAVAGRTQRAEEAERQRKRLGAAPAVPGSRTPPRTPAGTYTSEEDAFNAGFNSP